MENKKRLILDEDAQHRILQLALSRKVDVIPLDMIAYVLFYDTPAVDTVEVVHAQWIRKGNMIWCSHCGDAPIDDAYNWYPTETPYCPLCGAKMDGGDNNG